jgi:hypothetical protein
MKADWQLNFAGDDSRVAEGRAGSHDIRIGQQPVAKGLGDPVVDSRVHP